MPKSLSVEVQRRLTPSAWHTEYRHIEDFIYYKRLFRERSENTEAKGLVKAATEELTTFSNQADSKFLEVLKELIDHDMIASNKVSDQYEDGTLPALAEEATHNCRDTLETPPIARTGHFAFALMDLIQQHLPILNPDAHFSALVDLALDVASSSNRSFLRAKALELLFNIGKSDGVGLAKVETYFINAVKKERKGGNLNKVSWMWQNLKKRMEEMNAFREQLPTITVFSPSRVWLLMY